MESLNQSCEGYITVKKLNSNGEILEIWESKNLIVNQGLNLFPSLIANKSKLSTQIKIGLSGTASTVTQTDLLSYYDQSASPTVTNSSNVLNVTSYFVAPSVTVIREFGLYFTNTMYSRVVNGTGISLGVDHVLQVTWSLTFSRV